VHKSKRRRADTNGGSKWCRIGRDGITIKLTTGSHHNDGIAHAATEHQKLAFIELHGFF
jgi:hypothetical protein